MEKSKLPREIEKKLEYIGLNLEEIPETLKYVETLNFKPNIGIEENKYRQYRFVSPKELEILISPCNRLEDTKTKYSKARPLVSYLEPKTEEEMKLHAIFLEMLREVRIEDIEKIEEQQQILNKKIPFKVRYGGNYLWQIYYSETDNKYFMIVTLEDKDYSTFFYVLKKQLEKKKAGKIFVPITNINYSKELLTPTELQSLENYIWSITNNWPSIYEVFDKTDKDSIQIVGRTQVLEKIESEYKVKLSTKIEADKFFKLVKILFILQSEISSYYKFNTQIDKQGKLEFYYKGQLLEYDEIGEWINSQYKQLTEIEKLASIQNIEYSDKLEKLKKESQDLEVEYLAKEKQISTFLECKKTFFGKVKYFFKYSGKKSKKKDEKKLDSKEDKKTNEKDKKEEIEKSENSNEKSQYTLDDLLEIGKKAVEQENNLKNTKMDINAIKLKKVNLTKKIENATAFIEEIDSHKKSIFEFWKYSNKDEVQSLAEGEEEVVNVKTYSKILDFDEEFEEYGTTMDKLQSTKLNKVELNALYLTTTNQLDAINKVKTNSLEPKELDKYLKELKTELKNEKDDGELDIFGTLEEDTRKIKKLANKTHRENPKNKFLILGITKQTKVVDYKVNLSQTIWRINEALDKITTSQDLLAYMWTEEDENIDANKFNVFNLDVKDEILKAIEKSKGNKVNLYKMNIKKGINILAFTNCVYYDNQNKTLPVGMDKDTRAIIKLKDTDITLDSKNTVRIGILEEDDNSSKLSIKTINVLEYTVNPIEQE